MADQVAGLEIRVESGSVDKAKKSLADLSAQGARAEASARKVGEASESASSGVARYSDSTRKANEATVSLVNSLKATVAGYVSLRGATAIATSIDEYTKYTAQLKLATRSTQEYQQALVNVRSISQKAQADVGAIGVLYARLNNSLRELGVAQDGISRVTETVSLALKASGASAAEASSAMLQLSQAFGSGVLRGEEFNAVAESAPGLLRALAESLNVPFGALKNMAAQGQLTSDVLYKAFSDGKLLDSLRVQAESVKTISGSLQTLKNVVIDTAGAFAERTAFVTLFSEAINKVSTSVKILKALSAGESIETSLDKLFPSYQKFAQQMAQLQEGEKLISNSAKTIIGRDSIMGELQRIDIGKIGQVNEEFQKIKQRSVAFLADTTNQLKDTQAALDEYKNKMAQVAEFEKYGLLTTDQARRYRAQYNEELKKGNKTSAETNSYAVGLANTYADLFTKAVALNAPQETQAQTLQRLLDGFKGADSAARQFIQTQIDLANSAADDTYIANQLKALDAQTESVLEQAKAVEAEVDAYGKLPSQITEVTIARLNDRKALLESLGLGVQDVEAQITAYERLRQAQSGKEFQEKQAAQQKATVDAAKKTADEVQRNYERASDNISRSLSDALMRGFENGKSFAENFKDTLVNMFKTLILQPVIKFLIDSSGLTKILGAVSGTLSGVANAGGVAGATGSGSTLSTLVSTGKSLYSAFTQGITGLNNTIVGSIGDLGTFLVDKGFNSLGGMIGQYNSAIAGALPYSAAVLQLLGGDVKGAAVTGITTAIGSAIAGPVGGAIGAAVGSLLGSAFGGRTKNPRIGASVAGTYSNGDFTSTSSKGGSKKLVEAYISPLTNLSDQFTTALGSFMKSLGQEAVIKTRAEFATKNDKGTIASFFGSINGNKFGQGSQSYSKDVKQAWNDFVKNSLGKTLVSAIRASDLEQGIKDLFKGFADPSQVSSLMQSVIQLNSASEELNDTYGITVETAAKIARAGGSSNKEIAEFAATFSSFALSLMKPSEQLLLAKSNITEAISEIVDSAVSLDSLSSFDALLKGIDTTTKEGQAQFAELFKLRDSFSSYIASLDSVKSSVDSTILSLMSPADQLAKYQTDLASAFDELNLSMPGSIEELIALGQSIDYTTEAGLDLALAFPSLVSAFQSAQSATDALMESLNSLDTNKFKTLFDLNRYKAVATNFGTSFADNYQKTAMPSFDVGTNYVPNDMTAKIHKGERIIPAADNAALMQKLSKSDNGDLLAAVNRLEEANKSMARNMASMERKISKWDSDGLPEFRDISLGA